MGYVDGGFQAVRLRLTGSLSYSGRQSRTTALSVRLLTIVATTALAALAVASCGGGGAFEPVVTILDTPTVTPTPVATPAAQSSFEAPAATPTSRPVPTPTATRSPAPVPAPATVLGTLPKMKVETAFPNLSFQRMVHLTYSGADDTRLFVVLQPGRILVFDNDRDVDSAELFLDIRGRVNDRGNEEGLLGLAFDPAYETNGHFYVYYSATGPRRSVISRFSVSPGDPGRADPSSELKIMEVAQPYANHNGGHLLFGPDGYLYIGLGDGGLRDDPHGNGQDPSTLLGSILRIDVSTLGAEGGYAIPLDNPFAGRGQGAREEVWAYGLRNPWRFTFDRETGDLWAGDVGQNRFEEVDLIRPGLNYGWNVMEAGHCFGGGPCEQEGLEPPVVEYGRDGGCSITGGYVYRGARLPELYGAYVYGDFCSGKIWGLRHDGESVVSHRILVDSNLQIPAFGEDPSGELYILSFGGKIYRLERD